MGDAFQETLCTHCEHLQVCKLCDTYLKAQNALNEVVIAESHVNDEGKPVTKLTYVMDLNDWLTIPQLKCRYYIQQIGVRNLDPK